MMVRRRQTTHEPRYHEVASRSESGLVEVENMRREKYALGSVNWFDLHKNVHIEDEFDVR